MFASKNIEILTRYIGSFPEIRNFSSISISGASVSGLVYGPYLNYRQYGEIMISENWPSSLMNISITSQPIYLKSIKSHTDGSEVLFEVLWIDKLIQISSESVPQFGV